MAHDPNDKKGTFTPALESFLSRPQTREYMKLQERLSTARKGKQQADEEFLKFTSWQKKLEDLDLQVKAEIKQRDQIKAKMQAASASGNTAEHSKLSTMQQQASHNISEGRIELSKTRTTGAHEMWDDAYTLDDKNLYNKAINSNVIKKQEKYDAVMNQLTTSGLSHSKTGLNQFIGSAVSSLSGVNIAHRVNQQKQLSSSFARGSSLAHNKTWEELVARQAKGDRLYASIASRAKAIGTDESIGPDEKVEQIMSLGHKQDVVERSQAQTSVAMSVARRAGFSPKGMSETVSRVDDLIGGKIHQSFLGAAVSGGRYTVKQAEASLGSAQSNLIKDREKLGIAERDGNTRAIDRLTRALGGSEKAYNKASKDLITAKQNAASAGPSWREKTSGALATGINLGEQAVGTYINYLRAKMTTRVDNKTLVRQQEAAYKTIVNEQYNDQELAAGGNMAAMTRIQHDARGTAIERMSDVFQRATGYTRREARTRSNMSTIKGAASIVGGILTGDLAQVASGFTAATNEGIQAKVLRVRAMSGTAGRGKALPAYQAEMALFDATNKIQVREQQAYMDYVKSTGTTTYGMGSDRERILGGMLSKEGLAAGASMSMAERMHVLGTVQSSSLSKGFDPARDFTTITGLRDRGLGDVGANMQRAAMLGSVSGDGLKELGPILREAVSGGLDDAKSMTALIQASVASAQSTGLAYTNADASSILAKNIMRSQDQNIANPALRNAMAASSYQEMGNRLNNQNVNLGNLMDMMGQSKIWGGSDAGIAMQNTKIERRREIESQLDVLLDPNASESDKASARASANKLADVSAMQVYGNKIGLVDGKIPTNTGLIQTLRDKLHKSNIQTANNKLIDPMVSHMVSGRGPDIEEMTETYKSGDKKLFNEAVFAMTVQGVPEAKARGTVLNAMGIDTRQDGKDVDIGALSRGFNTIAQSGSGFKSKQIGAGQSLERKKASTFERYLKEQEGFTGQVTEVDYMAAAQQQLVEGYDEGKNDPGDPNGDKTIFDQNGFWKTTTATFSKASSEFMTAVATFSTKVDKMGNQGNQGMVGTPQTQLPTGLQTLLDNQLPTKFGQSRVRQNGGR